MKDSRGVIYVLYMWCLIKLYTKTSEHPKWWTKCHMGLL